MKVREMYKAMIWIFAGLTISNLIFHFRFQNEYLFREMILIMESGQSYFLFFACVNIIVLIFGVGLYFFTYRKYRNDEEGK